MTHAGGHKCTLGPRPPQGEEPVDSDLASEHSYPVDRGLPHGLATGDPSSPEATPRVSTGAALLAISLISLGLWAVVVAAIGSLISALSP